MVLDELTLSGAAIGMVSAGILADLYGRKKLYGFELALLIVSTLGLVQASEGFRSQRPDGSAFGKASPLVLNTRWWPSSRPSGCVPSRGDAC